MTAAGWSQTSGWSAASGPAYPLAAPLGGTGQSTFTNGQLLFGRTSDGALVKGTFSTDANSLYTGGAGSGTLSMPYAGGVKLLGKLISANGAVTSDQALTMVAGLTKFIPTQVVFTNASVTPILAAGGIYTAASKGGTILFSVAQVYTALSATTKTLLPTITLTTDVVTTGTLFFSLTTANAAALTMDIYVFGLDLTAY